MAALGFILLILFSCLGEEAIIMFIMCSSYWYCVVCSMSNEEVGQKVPFVQRAMDG